MKAMKVSATLDSVKTLKDGSFKIVFETMELGNDDGAVLLSLRRSQGWLLFAPSDAADSIETLVPDEPPKEFKTDKSQGQRLRAILFVYWQQHKPTEKFDDFYKSQMERYIDAVREKLD